MGRVPPSAGGHNDDADCTTNWLGQQLRRAPPQPTRGLAVAWSRRDRHGSSRVLAYPAALGAGGDKRRAGSGATSSDPGVRAATHPGRARGAHNGCTSPGGQANHCPGRGQARRHIDRRRRCESSWARSGADHGLLIGRDLRTALLELAHPRLPHEQGQAGSRRIVETDRPEYGRAQAAPGGEVSQRARGDRRRRQVHLGAAARPEADGAAQELHRTWR